MTEPRFLFGQVMHERLRPVKRRFVYPVFGVVLDVDQLAAMPATWWFAVDRWRVLSIRQRDYGPRDGSNLAQWARAVLASAGVRIDGPIELHTFTRLWGYVFNPVSFWHCHDAQGQLRALIAEVNNTFGEHHSYVLTAPDGGVIEADTPLQSRKAFHVSPFCLTTGEYRFRLKKGADTRFTAVDYHDEDGVLLRTAIGGRLRPFTSQNFWRAMIRHPFFSFMVIGRIHWQALRLWLKRVPFNRKPAPPDHPLTIALEEKKQ
ncbi:DUF1365 domain-containing protein [Silvimonas iriomotensis]|uniref:DUF1365 domain-containing protein n=1 Tax=Silvimonas iriomotensis TaxID=449662 RepID=A0ABQ2P954_9NEIS|nr:DUF1365 domain-containing protein [Silvimonas iriomotensis]GGP21160.1 DUF1365 domain-containing protein [Silvimonas iriomotensis]